MGPKEKISKKDIIEVAFEIVRREGYKALSARTLARELELSTMPIYSQIGNMNELDNLLVDRVDAEMLDFQKQEYTDNTLLNMSIGYVLFAQEEKHLFSFLQHEAPRIRKQEMSDEYFSKNAINNLNQIHADSNKNVVAENFPGIQASAVGDLAKNGWIFTHGLASLLHSNLLPPMTLARIEKTVSDAGQAFFLLLTAKNAQSGNASS